VHRAVVAAIGTVAVSWCLGTPHAAADEPVCGRTIYTPGTCGFKAPSGSTSCEIHPDTAYCQTFDPPESVEMGPDGVLKIQKGSGSVGNPPTGMPRIEDGQTVTTGPFTCKSAPSGVTCTVPSGKGFTISAAGITPVG
jgi:hypothetical protein